MEVKTFFAQRLNGDVIANPTVYLYQPDTVTLVAGLADKNGSPIPNPFLGTGLGEICFAAPSGQYDMRIVGAGRDFTTRVHFLDVSDAVNAAVTTIQIQGQVYVAEAEDARDAAIVARDEAEAFAAQLGNVMLNDLGDVDVQTNPPVTGDGLIYNSISQRWEPGSPIGNINSLTDVDTVTTPPQDADALVFNASQSKWVPGKVTAKYVAPPETGWTWVNQGTATVTSTPTFQKIEGGAAGPGLQLRARVMTMPSTPFTLTAAIEATVLSKNFQGVGLSLRNSTSGALVQFHYIFASTQTNTQVYKSNSATSFNSDYLVLAYEPTDVLWMRLQDTGALRKCFVSRNGLDWLEIHSVSRTDFLTPDQIGFSINCENQATPNFAPILRLLQWELTTP